MPAIVTFDPTNLRIVEIDTGGDNVSDAREIYSEWKAWLLSDAQNMGHPAAFSIAQDNDLAPGLTSVPYFKLANGWKLRPAERDHKWQITGNMIVDGGVGSIFVPTLGAFTVHTETVISPQGLIFLSGNTIAPTQQEIRDALKLAPTAGAPSAGSIDDRLDVVDATIADTKTKADLGVAYAEAGDTLRIVAWMVRDGSIVTGPTAITITWRDTDGSVLFTLTEADAIGGQDPDAAGVYAFTRTQALADDQNYPVDVTITDGSGPRSDRHKVQTIKGT